jgi:glycosyltransferase involved in cell wall biosynthesis
MGQSAVPVTVIIPTLNEAEQIAECIGTAAWADEIIVADAGSSDATVFIAEREGAVVLVQRGPTIAAQRNAAISRSRNKWILAVDADERITPELREEIPRVIGTPSHAAYRIRRRNFYLGKEVTRGHWGKDWVVRLFTRDRRYIDQRVHERLESVPETGNLTACLDHIPYRDLSHQLEKMNRYARWGAEDLYQSGRRAGVWDLTGRPLGRFLRSYLLQGSCWDGLPGVVASSLGAYTAFLKYAHLWALDRSRMNGPSSP